MVCLEKRREYFLAAQSCYAKKVLPKPPSSGAPLAAKAHWTFGPARPCKLHAGFRAGEAFESDLLPLQSILYVFE